MIVYDLNKELNNLLPRADEIYLAVALIKEYPLNELLKIASKKVSIKIIVGVDLPTTVETLEFLQKEQKSNILEAVMFFDQNKTFHPKLYILKINNKYIAFIGSANLTNGGLSNNFELTYKITNSAKCIELLEWFKTIYNLSFPINDKNIEEYKNKTKSLFDKQNQNKLKLNFYKNSSQLQTFNEIDFSDRFFKKEHHFAFREELWYDNSLKSNKERKEAENKFLDLNNIIFQKFYDFGLIDLHTNREGSIVSRHHQINESSPRRLNAMWLSYGKAKEEIKIYKSYFIDKEQKDIQTFIHHARLQIRIELLKIGIWLLFGKENKGSIFDRESFKKNMRDSSFRNNFHKLITSLPKQYWIRIDNETRDCSSFNSPEELHEFCKRDNIERYFIIGRNYEIADVGMSENNLPNTVLLEFQRLYPFYIKMKHKIS